jgi:7-cyano-7-deazaguanine synthase
MSSLVLLSGGLDSSVLLAHAVAKEGGSKVLALTFQYGQRHRREVGYAKVIAEHFGAEHEILELAVAMRSLGGALLDPEGMIPDGHYTDQAQKITVVPGRNMIFLSFGLSIAMARGLDEVLFAGHAGDHAVYPDCRFEFIRAMKQVALVCGYEPVRLDSPFKGMTKAEIVELGDHLKVPFKWTWSCYRGLDVHCGTCGTCVERREAFELAQVPDPTVYARVVPRET